MDVFDKYRLKKDLFKGFVRINGNASENDVGMI